MIHKIALNFFFKLWFLRFLMKLLPVGEKLCLRSLQIFPFEYLPDWFFTVLVTRLSEITKQETGLTGFLIVSVTRLSSVRKQKNQSEWFFVVSKARFSRVTERKTSLTGFSCKVVRDNEAIILLLKIFNLSMSGAGGRLYLLSQHFYGDEVYL